MIYAMQDADEQWRQDHQARVEYIIDSAKECGTDDICEWCPWRSEYGCGDEFPRCEAGRTIRNNGGVI